jgi:coenzyme F420-reducing hydrogenase alpha subunit
MHLVDFDLTINEITKVEGSAGLDVRVKNGKVEEVKFKVQDYKRFYTQAIQGKPIAAVPQLLSRICGTCSNAHLMASIEAVEKTLNFTPSEQTKILRILTYHGLIIRDHALHLYVFVLPDLFQKDSLLDFDEHDILQHQLLHDTFAVKSAGNNLAKYIAGRSVHAPLPVVGGFLKIPDNHDKNNIIEELKKVRPAILRLIEIFGKATDKLERQTNYIALRGENFSYLEGKLYDMKGLVAEEKDFRQHVEKVVLPYSQAIAYNFAGVNYRVGALARINLNKDILHTNTKKDTSSMLKLFPSHNIYHNNLAQAIEILHSLDDAIDILQTTTFKPEKPIKLEMKQATGIGVVEAPRGTLYHKLEVDAKGIVQKGEVIVPTGQNQISIELDIKDYIQNNLDKTKEELALDCEKIIRAYDPCMSCASHFLEVNWIE